METTRQNKIARLLQKELGDIFQKQTQATHGVLVSVSAVRISPDLSVARGYLSISASSRRNVPRKSWTTSTPTSSPSATNWAPAYATNCASSPN